MVELPLIRTAPAIPYDRQKPFSPRMVSKATSAQQLRTLGPKLESLRKALEQNGGILLRQDPDSLAPERAVVFEVAFDISGFSNALSQIPGFEILDSETIELSPSERFENLKKAEDGSFQRSAGSLVVGIRYCAMPSAQSLTNLLTLWDLWQKGKPLPTPFKTFGSAFSFLADLRPWGPKDRVSEDVQEYLSELLESDPNREIALELAIWYSASSQVRSSRQNAVSKSIRDAGGKVLKVTVIEDIAYHCLHVSVPASSAQNLSELKPVGLTILDPVMFVKSQSLWQIEAILPSDENIDTNLKPPLLTSVKPIAALLDNSPISQHELLSGRLRVDDPDDLSSEQFADHSHGTAMASLIIYGDLDRRLPAIGSPLYVRPILPERQNDDTPPDFVETVYRAIIEMVAEGDRTPAAPSVFIVNLSIGLLTRPFTRLPSPLARVLDLLAYRFGILFIVSAGNSYKTLKVPRFRTGSQPEGSTQADREVAILEAMLEHRASRTMLSPAESVNAITVGAEYRNADVIQRNLPSLYHFAPYTSSGMPGIQTSLGLGVNASLKPDILMPGGRELFTLKGSGGDKGIEIVVAAPTSGSGGIRVAGLSGTPEFRPSSLSFSGNTSAAAAQASNLAVRLWEFAVGGLDSLAILERESKFPAVITKALLVHGASWDNNAETMKQAFKVPNYIVQSSENVARMIGYGPVDMDVVLQNDGSIATLIDYGNIAPDSSIQIEIPIPMSWIRGIWWRSLAVTLAWLSPVSPLTNRYNTHSLDFKLPTSIDAVLGFMKGKPIQPHPLIGARGTVIHRRYGGNRAVPELEGNTFSIQMWCRAPGVTVPSLIPYALVVSVDSAGSQEVHLEMSRLVANQRMNVGRLRP